MSGRSLAKTASSDLEALRESAYSDLDEANKHAALAVVYAARAGGRFLAMKTIVESTRGYGSWGVWVAANVQLSARSVQFYMQLARTLPALADPDADVEKVFEANPAARELAGLSLHKAMQKLAEPKALPKPKADEPDEPQPTPDPEPIVRVWVQKQLPFADDDARGALVSLYLEHHPHTQPDGELIELLCSAWLLGQRAEPRKTPPRRR